MIGHCLAGCPQFQPRAILAKLIKPSGNLSLKAFLSNSKHRIAAVYELVGSANQQDQRTSPGE
jgi:hypothetical protein